MAKKAVLEIDSSQVVNATRAISEADLAIARQKKALQEYNKVVKDAVEIERAQNQIMIETGGSYYDKQRKLTALGKVIRSYVANTDEEKAHLESLKKQYADLNTELKEFDATMGNHQRNVGNYNESVAKPLTLQLKEMQRAMAEMIIAGKEGSAEYQQMAEQAGKLQDAIGDANNEVKRFANDTMVMSDVVDITKSAVGAFGLLQSATALLGVEDENLVKSIQKLQAAQTALNSLQQLQQTILNKSSGTYKAFLWVKSLFVKETQTATVALQGEASAANVATTATNRFKSALVKTGIGAIIVGLSALVAKVYEYIQATKDEEQALRDKNKQQAESLKLYEDETKAREKALHDKTTDERTKKQEVYNKLLAENKELTKQINNELTLGSREYNAALERRIVNAKEMAQLQKEIEEIDAKKAKEEADAVKKAEEEKRKERERQYQEWLKNRDKMVADYEKGNKDLYDGISDMQDRQAKQREKDFEDFNKDLEKRVQAQIAWNKKQDELEKEREAKKKEQQQATINKGIELQQEVMQGISDVFQAQADAISRNIEQIDKEIDRSERQIQRHQNNITNYMQMAEMERGAERDALIQAAKDEQAVMKEKEKAEDEARKKKEKLEKEQKVAEFKAKKTNLANQLLQGLANTALGVTQALAQTPPASYVMAALTGAMGAVQTGIIASQMGKLKMANGGLLDGPLHSQGGIPIGNTGVEVEGGEYVVNRRSTAEYLPLLEAINERGRRRYADGGQLELPSMNTTNELLARMNINPVVSVVDINRASNRLSSVQVLSR